MAEKKPKAKAIPKPIHATVSPYQKPRVDKIGQPHHDVIADRLVSILEPIREWRAKQPVSKGKKSKKRKRCTISESTGAEPTENENEKPSNPAPPIAQHPLLGFSHVTRHLEELSSMSAPQRNPDSSTVAGNKQHVAAVFLFHPLDDLIYSHLPLLCHTASLAHADRPATRLMLLDPAVEKRVADAVGLPRASVLGVLYAPEGESKELSELIRYVQKHCDPVEVPWLTQAREGKWLGTMIHSQ